MDCEIAPQGATGEVCPWDEQGGTSVAATTKAPVGTGKFTRRKSTPRPAEAPPVEARNEGRSAHEEAVGAVALAPTFRTPEELVVPFELAPTTPEARAFLLACVARVTAGTDVLLHPAVYLAAVLFGAGWLRVRPRGRKALRLLIARDVEIAVQAWTRAKFNDEGAALLYSLANPRQRTEGEARRFAGRVVRRQRQTWWNRPRMPKDYRWPDSFAGFQGALVMAVRAWPSIPLCCWTHHMLAHSDFPKWTFWKSPGRYANFIVGMAGIQTLHMRPRSAEGIFGNLIEQRLHNANGTVLFEESVPLYRVLAARLSTNGGAV